MENFTPIRNGIREHLEAGKMSPFDLGIYTFLLLSVDWGTGVYHGCALTIAFSFGDSSLKAHIQRALRRLRNRCYINYRKGDGRRHGYSILIHKYEPTAGELLGMRLNAWKYGDLSRPYYEPKNCGDMVATQSRRGERAVVTPIQDSKPLDINKDNGPVIPFVAIPDLLMIWNNHCGGLPRIREMTQSRKNRVKARLHKETFERDFTEVVKKAASTPFLLGENDRGWKASFDWLIKNDTNCVAVLEGKYDGKISRNYGKSGAFFSAEDRSRYERDADFTLRVS
jgi:hypothetical protein